MIRTKILATVGPASSDPEILRRLFEAGADVCRLNFSHGDPDRHLQSLHNIRAAAKDFDHPIAVMGDLCGPKIRLGQVADQDGSGGMLVNTGDDLIVQRQAIIGERGRVSSTYEKFVDDVNIGDRVYIEDGLLRFVCTDKTPAELRLRCTAGGIVKSSKGVNLPSTAISLPSITERDWMFIDWAVANDVDYLALSFVRKADELIALREHLNGKKCNIGLIAKIEKAEALAHLDAIVEVSDGLMVARGDLGVEMDVAQVPLIQKDLIKRCQSAGKTVIVATQMLQSMVEASSPTRAEVSDVANAILDGTDAVMLSAETAVGKFPVGAVHVMAHIAEVTEAYMASTEASATSRVPKINTTLPAAALARGAWRIVHDLQTKLVVIFSQTGATARVFAKHHFPVPIISMSSDERVLRRMAMLYGVVPQHEPQFEDLGHLIAAVDELLLAKKFAEKGDRIVVVAGWSPAMPDTMNGLVMHTVGDAWATTRPAHLRK